MEGSKPGTRGKLTSATTPERPEEITVFYFTGRD
jgi:hypothetical protein